jgi:hypothetical protein
MKQQWIILITVVATAILVGSVTYFYVNARAVKDRDNLQTQLDDLKANANTNVAVANTNENTNAVVVTNANTNAVVVDWKAYTNSTYGFTLTLPNDAWENYKVISYTPTDKVATKYLYFAVPTTDANWNELRGEKGYASPIAITVYTQAEWTAAKSDTLLDSPIGQNSKYVYTISGWQDSPTDLASVDFATNALKTSFKAN